MKLSINMKLLNNKKSFNSNFIQTTTPQGRYYTPFFNSLIPKSVFVEKFYNNSVQTCRSQLATLASEIL